MDGFKRRLSDSIQLRLSFTLSIAIFIVACAAAAFAFMSAFDEAHEAQDGTLRQIAVLLDRQGATMQAPTAADIADDNEDLRFVVQYLDDGHGRQGHPDSALALPLPQTLADGISTMNLGGEHFRVLVRTLMSGERIAVAQETGKRDRDARESAWRSLLPFLILFPVLLLVVGDLIRKVFRPIATLSAEVDSRTEHALHPVDEAHVPREIRPFVVAINRLLGRVEQAMDMQARFVADAAHELRSPLTALSLQAERLANAEMPPEAQQRLVPLRRGIERGRNLLDQLLSLTRAQATQAQPPPATSVHAVFRQVLEDLLPLAQAKNIDIGVDSQRDIRVLMHEIDLHTVIKNLVDNAIRYTPYLGQIDLSVVMVQGRACVQVSDSGPGIAKDEWPRIFDPFYRILGSSETGSGLGLAIVKAIADRNGAQIQLGFKDEVLSQGFYVCVFIPRPLASVLGERPLSSAQ